MANTTMDYYTKLTIKVGDAEEDYVDLHALGILGSEILDSHSIGCFLNEDETIKIAVLALIQERNWEIITEETVANRNWVQECSEVWQPLTVGSVQLCPVLSENKPQKNEINCIYIVPGEGFGTGHHPSTRLAIHLIEQTKQRPSIAPQQVLDYGTGNGILAIMASMMWSKASILAIDNDPSALPNAYENCALNNCLSQITLQVNTLDKVEGKFDLITANIYAEVLVASEMLLYHHLNPGGILILAGVMDSRAHLIHSSFIDSRWEPIAVKSEQGWDAFLYKRHA